MKELRQEGKKGQIPDYSPTMKPEFPKFIPSHPPLYFALANALSALNRFDEAKQVLHEALTHIPGEYPAFYFRIYLYALSFVTADSRGVAEYSAWLENHPVMEWMSLAIFADTAAYEGRLRKAREITRRAVELAPKGNMAGTTVETLTHAALREANIADMPEARRAATEALKLEPTARDVQIEAALVFAISGDSARSRALAQDLAKHYPLDTIVQTVWLPAIYAQLALKKNPILAVERLQVTKPLDLSWDARCLYPIYLRGEAYLAARQGSAAAAEFQKIIDHAGIVWTCWTGALAHLQLGRAYSADGDIAKARSAYQDFDPLERRRP